MNRPEPVLVSACLLGEPVRHDGGDKRSGSAVLARWRAEGRIVPVCPELAGGLPVPRPPAEIDAAAGGAAVLAGRARVRDVHGRDVSAAFVAGADAALALARRHGARVAVLKQASPSCGSTAVHDGTFAGRKVAGQGVAAARLCAAGIQVFDETRWDEADAALAVLDAAAPRELREADLPAVLRIRAAVTENRLVSRVIGADEVWHHCRELGRGWVAEDGGRVAGFAIGTRATGNLWALFVDPAFAGRGHGRRLHDTMVAWLFAQGLPRLVLGTDPATRAHAFYRRAGWRECGLDADGEMRMELDRPEETPA
jgi:uncharacterized protein YbbK (DUF523 family)/RimJ/RimL family protein N-acetyltransferase